MSHKLTQAQFLERAHAAHGDKYDYSQAVYSDMKTKILIICPTHGVFQQAPNQHLAGAECTRCGHKGRPLGLQTFKEKAQQIHGERYCYSQSVYKSAKTKMKIICSVHGVFEQLPDAHLRGRGCAACGHDMAALSTKVFIEKAQQVHGDRFDYSGVEYVNGATKVTIICPVHGAFEQLPNSHLKLDGCAKCSREALALGRDNFINKSRETHGSRYDYSQVIYTTNSAKVTIICPVHGAFEQRATNHMHKRGCPACGGQLPSTIEYFLERAAKVHGSKFDYSQVNYVNAATKVLIICPKHGSFEQAAGHHLLGNGCPTCRYDSRRNTLEDFINKARQIHSEKYSYQLAAYKGHNNKVTIICPVHGAFEQDVKAHLVGSGCPQCAFSVHLKCKEEFVQKAQQHHGGKYDYSQTDYTNARSKVTIICPTHGPFKQAAEYHLKGKGCAKCVRVKSSGLWSADRWAAIQGERTALLYLVKMSKGQEVFYKAGITLQSIAERFKAGTTPYRVEVLALFTCDKAASVHRTEAAIKKQFKGIRYTPSEWFGGHTECYFDAQPILNFLATQSGIQQC